MNNSSDLCLLKVNDINLWAHVGVLEEERIHGQSFLLDLTISLDLKDAVNNDDLKNSVDYSIAITKIQQLSLNINCKTIEYFSEKILDLLESLYGFLPIEITLTKCSPPIAGFNGSVALTRNRNLT